MTTRVEAYPSATEVAVIHLPAGATARVHHPDGVREYTPMLPDVEDYAVIPGDKDLTGWGAVPCWHGSLAGVRNGRHRLDRDAWHAAATALRAVGVVYVQYEARSYHGKARWTAVSVRREAAASLPLAEQIGAVHA